MTDKYDVRDTNGCVSELARPRLSSSRARDLTEAQFLARMLTEIETMVRLVVPAPEVLGRIKTVESTVAKAKRIAAEAGDVHDKVGIRVIVPSTEHCFVVVHKLHSSMEPVMTSYDDYINNPKPNGYQALHTTLLGIDNRLLEVQVRSRKMHHCAENGSAQHRLYKAGQEGLSRAGMPCRRKCGSVRVR